MAKSSKSKSGHSRKAARVGAHAKVVSKAAPDLDSVLTEFHHDLNDTACELYCAMETIEGANIADDEFGRGLNVAHRARLAFDALVLRFDDILVRIAHEGIPAKYPKGSATGSPQP